EDARRWGWDVVKLAIVLLGLLGVPMMLVPDLILGVFLHEPEALEIARLPLRLVGAMIALDGVGMVLMNALMGAGDNRRVMIVSVILQWGVFLPVAYLVGPVLGFGLIGIWTAQVCYRGLHALSMTALWARGHWMAIKI
ncbi:MAG: hypothetical protein KC636_06140, partial [Myxococcales bacterium]|nr:hypothetical protein [Myxococcales bacterium]